VLNQPAFRGFLFLACAAAANAQTPPARPNAGLEADWDIAPVLQQIGAFATRLAPALDKVDPQIWAAKGASETYLAQLQSSKEQVRALADQSRALARNPEKLSAALEVLFRIQGIDSMLSSLVEALRKYRGAADAQALESLAAQDGAGRDRLQGYIVNLAVEREHDLEVMDKEAQRCRGQAPPTKAGRKP